MFLNFNPRITGKEIYACTKSGYAVSHMAVKQTPYYIFVIMSIYTKWRNKIQSQIFYTINVSYTTDVYLNSNVCQRFNVNYPTNIRQIYSIDYLKQLMSFLKHKTLIKYKHRYLPTSLAKYLGISFLSYNEENKNII